MRKLCVFDLDGTTVDTLQDLCLSVNYALKINELPAKSAEELCALVGHSTLYMCTNAIAPALREQYTKQVLDDYNRHYARHFCDHSRPYTGMKELMDHLHTKGIRTALVSNKPHRFTARMIDSIYPNDSFSMVLGMLPKFAKKPDPEPLMFVLNELGVKPEEALYVGDSEVDIEFAKNTGMPCISVTWGLRTKEQLLEAGAGTLVDTPEELYSAIIRI